MITEEQEDEQERDEIGPQGGKGAGVGTTLPYRAAMASIGEEGEAAEPGVRVSGGGYRPALPDQTAGRDLGEFATATGTEKPAPTPLQKLGPAPPTPTASPDLAKTEADLREHAALTPRFYPGTKNVRQEYEPSAGARIGRAFGDFATGGIRGVVKGAFGDPTASGYYGRGAVNSQYFRDEAARQQATQADQARIDSLKREDEIAQRDYKNKLEAWKDQEREAFNETTTQERARHQEQTEELTQQLRDVQTQLADAKEPGAKLSAEIDARGVIAKKTGLKGQAAIDYILYGDKAGMLAVDRMRVRTEEMRLGIERERLGRDKKAVNEYGYTADEQRGINIEAPGALKRLQDLEAERAKNIAAGGTGAFDTKKLDEDITATRKQVQDAAAKVRNARPTPVPQPGPGRPRPGATPQPAPNNPGAKGTITRTALQAAVDNHNAKNPGAKVSYAQQKKNAEARGVTVDESK